jgi:hypothetical protein
VPGRELVALTSGVTLMLAYLVRAFRVTAVLLASRSLL